MISKCIYKKTTWVDLESPTRDEIQTIREEFDLPDMVAEELRSPIFRAKVVRYPNCIYLILHFPSYSKKAGRVVEQEVDFIIGKDFVITAHYEPVNAITEFAKLFEINATLDRGVEMTHAGFLFFLIIEELYRSLSLELETINVSIRDIEQHLFGNKENKMIGVISLAHRTVIDFTQAIRFHEQTLRSLEQHGVVFFGKEFEHQLMVISGEYHKVQKTVDEHRQTLRDLRETNNALLVSKTNNRIAQLTTTIVVLGVITVIALGIIIYFINKTWL